MPNSCRVKCSRFEIKGLIACIFRIMQIYQEIQITKSDWLLSCQRVTLSPIKPYRFPNPNEDITCCIYYPVSTTTIQLYIVVKYQYVLVTRRKIYLAYPLILHGSSSSFSSSICNFCSQGGKRNAENLSKFCSISLLWSDFVM